MPPKAEKHVRKPDRPATASWKLNELVLEFIAWFVSCFIKFKEGDKLVKIDGDGQEIDPYLLPLNVASKGHWVSAEQAIADASSMYIDRESLKAYGSQILKLIKKYKENVNALGEPDPWPNTGTAERLTATRKKIEAEFPSLRSSVSPNPFDDDEMDPGHGAGAGAGGDNGSASGSKKRKTTSSLTSLAASTPSRTVSLTAPARTSSFRPVTPQSDEKDDTEQRMLVTYARQAVDLLGKMYALQQEAHKHKQKKKATKLRGALQALSGKTAKKGTEKDKEQKEPAIDDSTSVDYGFPLAVDLSSPHGMGPDQIALANATLSTIRHAARAAAPVHAALDLRIRDGRIRNQAQYREAHEALTRLHTHNEVVDAWQSTISDDAGVAGEVAVAAAKGKAKKKGGKKGGKKDGKAKGDKDKDDKEEADAASASSSGGDESEEYD